MEKKQITVGVEEDFTVGRVKKSRCAAHCHGHKKEVSSLLPHCMMCGEIPEGGIMGGIFLRGQFLCDECEREIVALDGDALSTEEYLAVADKLKGLWKMA